MHVCATLRGIRLELGSRGPGRRWTLIVRQHVICKSPNQRAREALRDLTTSQTPQPQHNRQHVHDRRKGPIGPQALRAAAGRSPRHPQGKGLLNSPPAPPAQRSRPASACSDQRPRVHAQQRLAVRGGHSGHVCGDLLAGCGEPRGEGAEEAKTGGEEEARVQRAKFDQGMLARGWESDLS